MQALLRGVDVVVATPGRLIDHMNEGNILLASTEVLVLDEADQMMDLGFIKPLRQIISKLSSKRQSMFFSATMPQEIGSLAAELLRDPYRVSVTPVAKTADRVAQKVVYVEQQKKRALLVELFGDQAMTRTLIFTRTKRGADRVARSLEQVGVDAASIHGDKSQGQRERALADFKAGKVRALVATDIAARGIDIDSVSHVVQFELPNVPESYVHRIGRTARAGADGSAVAFCSDDERTLLRDIQKVTRQTIPSFDRRNDKQLGAASAAMPEPQGIKPERADTRGQPNHRNGPKRNRNHGSGGAPGHRHEGAPARGNGGGNAKPAARPAFKGPARGGGNGEQRRPTGVWSNR
jgi:ATP-dependent RNA helicase RhlE